VNCSCPASKEKPAGHGYAPPRADRTVLTAGLLLASITGLAMSQFAGSRATNRRPIHLRPDTPGSTSDRATTRRTHHLDSVATSPITKDSPVHYS